MAQCLDSCGTARGELWRSVWRVVVQQGESCGIVKGECGTMNGELWHREGKFVALQAKSCGTDKRELCHSEGRVVSQ